jgi:hypothetical protein
MFSYVANREYRTTYMLDSNKVGGDEREVVDLAECVRSIRGIRMVRRSVRRVSCSCR